MKQQTSIMYIVGWVFDDISAVSQPIESGDPEHIKGYTVGDILYYIRNYVEVCFHLNITTKILQQIDGCLRVLFLFVSLFLLLVERLIGSLVAFGKYSLNNKLGYFKLS